MAQASARFSSRERQFRSNKREYRSDTRRQRVMWTIAAAVVLLIFLIFFLFPFYWMFITAFKSNAELQNPASLPLVLQSPTLDNVQVLFNKTPFLYWFGNSALVATLTTLFSVTVSTLAAYALVRFRFRGAQAIGMGIFITYLVPPTLLFIPMTLVVRSLGLYNNLLALIVVYPTLMVPFCTWLLMGFFRTIPRDLEECARVDGATYWQAFRRIILPISRPGLTAAAIFTFTLSWGEYIYALVVIPSRNLRTLPVGVPSELTLGDIYMWGSIMSAALIGSLPIAIVFALSMQSFVTGLTAGAVKG